MLVTTTERIPGQEYEVLGECFGVTTQSRDIISNFGAGLKNLVGGEIVSGRKPYQLRRGLRLLQQNQMGIFTKVLEDG